MNTRTKVLPVALLSVLLTQQVLSQTITSAVKWIGPNSDWQPQDYFDSRGITAARFENGRLVLTAKLQTGQVEYGKGEALLDMAFFPELECQSPIDLSGREMAVEVEVPAAFAGTENNPSRLYLFVKDESFASSYSAATNVTRGGKFPLTFKPMASAVSPGSAELQFNPARIRIIGVKIELGGAAMNQFEGVVYINSVNITPLVMASVPPKLPVNAPLPVMLPGDKIEVRDGNFYLNEKKWFIVGANWRLTEYGQNFGTTEWFPFGNGVAKHPNFTRINLEYARRAGIKLLRVGLLDDGRVVFDRDGRVIRYDGTFREDIRTLLNLAQQAGIRIEFTLCDFLLAGKGEEVDRVWVRGRRGVIADPILRADFRAKFWVPFLQEWGTHPALFGFDLINEPEWIVKKSEGGGWEDYHDLATKAEEPVARETLHAFINECSQDVRQFAPGKLITVGVSARFISLVNTLTSLSYFAPHHYHWMGNLSDAVPSFLGRSWMLEEFPTKYAANAVPNSLRGYLDSALSLRSTGALFWNLTPGIDPETCLCTERADKLVELRNWVDSHAADIYPQTRPLANVSAASFQETELASEMIVSGFGSGLATATLLASNTPLPTALAGTSVGVKDNAGVERLAGLFYVSPTQINYLIPVGTTRGAALITVTSGDATISSSAAHISTVSPGLFTANQDSKGAPAGFAIHIEPNGNQRSESLYRFDPTTMRQLPVMIDFGPENEVVILELYGTGIRGHSAQSAVSVTIGGGAATVEYADKHPAFAGLDQVNVRVPRSLSGRGVVDLVLTVEGKAANIVQVAFK